MYQEKRMHSRGCKMNQTIKQHLDERERVTTRKLLAEMNSNVPNLTHISVLRQELRDIQDERNEYEEKDICNKYNQEQIGGIL
jgi:hypothetical protein